MRLKGKVALITGAGSGFGEGISQRFAKEGANVAIIDINPEAGQRVANDIDNSLFVEADVANSASVKNMVTKTIETFGGLDILVNNAGITHRNQPMLEVDEKTFDRIFAVNVKSVYLTAIHAVPILRHRKGRIVNIASTAGISPRPGLTWYNSTKGAMITMTKSMAAELAPDGIRVNAVNPVIGETGLTLEFMGGVDDPKIREKFLSTIPLRRMSTPVDIANAALFLASDEANLITGVCLEVDGGRCI